MKLNDLKVTRSSKVEEMSAIVDLANTENRNMSVQEQETWRGLETEVSGLDSQIQLAEKQEDLNRSIAENATMSEINKENQRNLDMPNEIKNKGLETLRGLIASQGEGKFEVGVRARADVADVQADTLFPEIGVIGNEPVDFAKLNVKVKTGVKGVLRVPYMTPAVAKSVAESAEITAINGHNPNAANVVMTKVAEKQLFTYEELADLTEDHFNQVVADLKKAIDRKITQDIYTAFLTGTEVASVDALDRTNMVELRGACTGPAVKLYMNDSTFWEGVGVKIDAGSGKYLFTETGEGEGRAEFGTAAIYSDNFLDGTNQKYVVAASRDAVVLGLGDYYGYSKYTDEGIEVSLIQMRGVAIANPLAIRKSADLDAAV